MTSVPFLKGHGTGNDFVLLPDHDARRFGARLDAALVRGLCDRRRGVGGDGVIRVVRAQALSRTGAASATAPLGDDPRAEWFMDYLNADGSVAEMCGNGIRVLARYLLDSGLAGPTPVAIGTRAGVMTVREDGDGHLSVDMGPARAGLSGSTVEVEHAGVSSPGTAVALPNPHAVVPVLDVSAVGPLSTAPRLHPAALFPDGANVEFVQRLGPRHLRMRVWERGVGETLSCGTGVCAAAWVAMRDDLAHDPSPTYQVDVPGGTLHVTRGAAGSLHLRGPAVLVAEGRIDCDALPR